MDTANNPLGKLSIELEKIKKEEPEKYLKILETLQQAFDSLK